MNLLRTLWHSLGQQRAIREEIDDELRFHLEQRTAENLAAGMSLEDAARAARKRFGNFQRVREESREARGTTFGETTLRDVRFACRVLRKNRVFTTVAVLTLALGIGAASAVFSLVQGVLLTPPPYPKAEQIVLISPLRKDGQPQVQATAAQWAEWQGATNSFAAVAGYGWTFQLLVRPDGSESAQGLRVTPDYFKVIGVRPMLGREFGAADMPALEQKPTVLLLGYDCWKRKFGGDPNIVGKVIHLSRFPPVTVLGVMPPGQRFLPCAASASEPNYDVNGKVDFWMPLWAPDPAKPNGDYCEIAGRLREGKSPEQAQAELAAISARQARADRDFEGVTVKAKPLIEELNRDGRRLLLPLCGAVALVLLIACANVAGVQLALGLRRQPEYAIRGALGARRGQLFRQALTESLVLALLGGMAGAALAYGTVTVLKAIGGFAIPRLDAVAFGWPVWAFCFGATLLAATLAGLMPAYHASRFDPANGLKGAGTSTQGRAERRFLGGVAMTQIALTLALLVGAGLLIRTVHNLAKMRPGYDTENILTMSVTLPEAQFDLQSTMLERVSAIPGVKKAAYVWGAPLTGNHWMGKFKIVGQASGANDSRGELLVPTRSATPDYFDALGVRIVSGRGFRPTDAYLGPNAVTNGQLVMVINQTLADKYFAGVNPVGRKLLFFPYDKKVAEIVGVVTDSRSDSLAQKPQAEAYFPLWQMIPFTKHLVLRTAADPRTLIPAVERELRALDPTVAIENVKTLEEVRSDSVAAQVFAMRLLVGFSIVGSVLALVGIYGVLSLSVGSRTREIAIRLALGAQRRSILGMVLVDGLKVIIPGLIIGTVAALALARLLRTLLFGVEPADPATFVAVAILFAAVALLACWLPARRATQVSPMEALRCE